MPKTKTGPIEKRAYELAEEFKSLVLTRINVKAEDVACPREKSFMTPCLVRDGRLAVAFADDGFAKPICVGCGHSVRQLIANERAMQEVASKKVTPTAVPTWALFLRVRHELILEWIKEGQSFELIAINLSMDPGQVRLISMTPLNEIQPVIEVTAKYR